MQDIYGHVTSVLKATPRFIKDGKLLKNRVVEAALKPDPLLLQLLMTDNQARRFFFEEIEGTLIFDKVKFQKFIMSKQFLPGSYTGFKNRIGLMASEVFLTEAKEVVLSFPYKDCVLEGGQTKEEENTQEIFWNKTLSPEEIDRLFEPKVLVNWKLLSAEGIHRAASFKPGSNLLIRGNNLLALHSIKRVYHNKVKLIYIDPPYNTGNDSFRYNDRFTRSTWLTFMMNRLEVARELLSEDGVILIQIDNKEAAYLKVLCDEVFGVENYRNTIIVKKGTKSLQKQFSRIQRLNAGYDSLLLYTKTSHKKIPNLFKSLSGALSSSWNNHWRGTDRPTMRYELFGITPEKGQWRWERERTYRAVENYKTLLEFIERSTPAETILTEELIVNYYQKYLEANSIQAFSDFELIRLSSKGKPEHYIPPRTEILLSENWMDLSAAGRTTLFEHEKNEEILQRIIEWLTKRGDTVLDFFLGSGTTAAVAHKLGRHYIGIEQMDYGQINAFRRILRVIQGEQSGISKAAGWRGGGECYCCELLPQTESLLKAIHQATEKDIDSVAESFMTLPYVSWRLDAEKFKANFSAFTELPIQAKKEILKAMIDYNQLFVGISDLDNQDYAIEENDKAFNRSFFAIKNKNFV